MTHSSDNRSGFRSLLVPIDLSPASDCVLGRVALLPLARKARLTLLHVVPDTLPVTTRRRAELDAMKVLAEEARSFARSLPRDVSVVPVVTAGTAAAKIASHSAETKAELIAMGRGGGRTLRDMFLGSTAERVVRRTQLPVLVVRLPPRAPYGRPAIALNLDDAAMAALEQLLKVISSPRSPVTVIHAYDAPYYGLIYPSLSEEGADKYRGTYRRKAAVKIGELLSAALAGANVPVNQAPTWRMHIQRDSPRLVIAKAVRKAETDLLVLGTRGRSGLAYAFLGAVAGEVLRAVRCDVLVVPPSRHRKGGIEPVARERVNHRGLP